MSTTKLTGQLRTRLEQVAAVYEDSAFQQLRLLDKFAFSSHLRDRGLSLLPWDIERLSSLVGPIAALDGEPHWHPYQSWHYHRIRTVAEPRILWTAWVEADANWIGNHVSSHLSGRDQRLSSLQDECEQFLWSATSP